MLCFTFQFDCDDGVFALLISSENLEALPNFANCSNTIISFKNENKRQNEMLFLDFQFVHKFTKSVYIKPTGFVEIKYILKFS